MSYLILLFLLFSSLMCVKYNTNSELCYVTAKNYSNPFPNLRTCYIYSSDSCCVSIHDEIIGKTLEKLTLPACLKNHPELTLLFCGACSPQQPSFINIFNKTYFICTTLADTLWGKNHSSPSTQYDDCGLTFSYFDTLNFNNHGNFMPSKQFHNLTDFLHSLKVPFFEDYTFQIVPPDETGSNCFSACQIHNFSIILTFIILILVI